MANVAQKVFSLIEETVNECGVELWDVRFVKEGASHYLRIYIDSESGIGIDDCTRVSHAVDPIIDDADPIDGSYYLEVCSAGLSRELLREEHFLKMLGRTVRIKLYKPADGQKEIIGTLTAFDGDVTATVDGKSVTVKKGDYAKVTLCDEI